MESKKELKKKGFELPDTLIVLVFLILLAGICTYLVPTGVFDRVLDESGRSLVDAASYHMVDRTPVSLFNMVRSIPNGIIQSASIIAITLVIGATYHIIQATGAIDAGLGNAINNMQGGKTYALALLIAVFGSFLGFFLGSAESLLPFIPISIAAARAMKFDSITGVALILVGGGAGFAGSIMNPSTVVIAQGIAGLPLFSGMGLRTVSYVAFLLATVIYIYFYAKKIHKDPTKSSMYELDKTLELNVDTTNVPELTSRHKAVLMVFALGIAGLTFGVVKLKFGIPEIATTYLIISVIAGFVGGLSIANITDEFVAGARTMLYGALIVGFARGITIVLTEGNILDTITFYATGIVGDLPATLSAVGMFVVQSFINIVIPSGSGQAAVTMPIMAPLSDLIGVTRQTATLAFQFGDAFTNILTPTSGYFMAALAIGNIPWAKWAKWFLPLFAVWNVIAIVILVIAQAIQYGPF